VGVTQNKKRIVENYLVECARLGDKAAQEQLAIRFQKQFLAHAYRLLGDAELAKDAAQEGWIEIIRGIARLKDVNAFCAWSFRIITRKCAKQITGLKKDRELQQTMSEEPGLPEAEESGLGQANDLQLIRKALASLSAEHRAAITLFYLKDMSVAEIAVSLELPVGTVKTRLMHARNKLRAVLEGENHG
jgi:RNA polymerase sigma-70 factor (ECF subfamily)